MKRILAILLAWSCLAWAADFKPAKLLDVRDASQVGANTIADSSEGVTGAPAFVPAFLSRCQITVALDGRSYTAIFPVNKHLKVGDLNTGDFIPARIEGSRLVIKTLDGKQMKSKIVSREPLESAHPEKSAAAQKK
jgi:hypothetical protein